MTKASKANGPDTIIARLSARLAAQFVREKPYDFVEAIADDATKLAALAFMQVHGRTPAQRATVAAKRREKEIDAIAQRYGANLVRIHDPRGLWLGLKFVTPRYQSPLFPLI